MITMQNFLLHCASQSAMNTVHYLTRMRLALVLRKIHFKLDYQFHFCGICIVMIQVMMCQKQIQIKWPNKGTI